MAYDPYKEPDVGTVRQAPAAPPTGNYDPYREPDVGTGGDQPKPPAPTLTSRLWTSLADAASSVGAATSYAAPRLWAGTEQGLRDVLSKPAMWLETGAEKIGLSDTGTAERVRQDLADRDAQFQKDYADSNLASAGRVVGQTLATAPLLAGGGGLATAAATRFAPALVPALEFAGGTGGAGSLLGRGASLATQGAIQGGATGALTATGDESSGEAAVRGALAGGVAGPLIGAVAAPVRAALGRLPGMVDQDIAQWARTADSYGIKVPPSALPENRTFRTMTNALGDVPFSGAQSYVDAGRKSWQQAVAKQFGEDAPSGITFNVMDRAAKRIGNDFDTVANRTTINGATIPGDFAALAQDIPRWGLTPQQLAPIQAQVQNVQNAFRAGNGSITGKAYQTLTQRGGPLDTVAGSTDPSVAAFGMRIRGALDNAFQASASPQDQALLTQARQQYRAMKTVEPLVEQRGATGDINPNALLQQVRAQSSRFDPSTGGLAYTGGGPMGDLAHIGHMFFQPTPDSGTAARAAALGLMAGASGGAGALLAGIPGAAAAVPAIAANRGLQMWLRSPGLAQRMATTALTRGNRPYGLGNVAIPGLLGTVDQ